MLRIKWALYALAYHVVMIAPTGSWVYWRLLPFAGFYAHTKDFDEFRGESDNE